LLKYYRATDSSPERYEYMAVVPYKFDLINVKYLDPAGYTKKPFMHLVLPREIRRQIVVPEKYRREIHRARSLYAIHFITNSGKPEKHYGFFRWVPEMAENKLSGLDIATNPDLLYKYLKRY